MSEAPTDIVRVSRTFTERYWKEFEACGPRHRNVAHWLLDLGWSIREKAMNDYLAGEVKNG